MQEVEEKKCSGCGFMVPIEFFNFLIREKGLRESQCKKCRAITKKNWYILRKVRHGAGKRAKNLLTGHRNEE